MCNAHRRLVHLYVHTCARVQSNRLTERKVYSRTRPCVCMEMCAMLALTHTHIRAINERQRRSIRPGKSLRICRLSPLIWGLDLRNRLCTIFISWYLFPSFSVIVSILQIRSRMISSRAVTKARRARCKWCQFSTCKEMRSNCCLKCVRTLLLKFRAESKTSEVQFNFYKS